MKLTIDRVRAIFSGSDYAKGMEYFRKGAVVQQYDIVQSDNICIMSHVQGQQLYFTNFEIDRNGRLSGDCTCRRFEDWGTCKHIAAAMIHYCLRSSHPAESTDSRSRQMLETYLEIAQPTAAAVEAPVHLIPLIRPGSRYSLGNYPTISFRVGSDKLYAVKNVRSFLRVVNAREVDTYGKNYRFNHAISNFDPTSQALIELLFDCFPEYQTIVEAEGYSIGPRTNPNEVCLRGSQFDRFFDLFCGKEIFRQSGSINCLAVDDPQPTLKISPYGTGIQMELETDDSCLYFGNKRNLYCQTENTLLRCSKAYRDNVYPLMRSGSDRFRLAPEDIPTFCTCVLPRIRDFVPVVDAEGILQRYLPDDCTPCYYLDYEAGSLLVDLKFRYGEELIQHNVPAARTPHVKRNMVTERSALAPLEDLFYQRGSTFFMTEEQDPYDFLTGSLDSLRELGEVYLSQQLQNRQFRPSHVGVGLSVADGLLTLQLDTGEFPAEELESLYQSLLRKKKYHRLSDGRYLMLDGSGYEKAAEMAHMLQLTPRELAEGTVQLPAFRALYLDGLLSGSDGLLVTRDRSFRAMIRDFKAVGDSDYLVPAGLETTLRSYQRLGFQWLKTLESAHFGGILADEMGLGKTLQVITWLASLNREAVGAPSLVVCPASLILNWSDELARFAPQLRSVSVLGSAARRGELLKTAKDADVVVTSYELLRQDLKLYQQMQFYGCILDEAQHIKNQSTQISKAVKQINCTQRFILTGTPIENRLSELWNLFDFLMPGYLFTHNAFVEKLEKPILKSGDPEASAQLQRLVQPFLLRRLKKDVLRELPPKIEYVRTVPLSEQEHKVYLSAVNAAVNTLQTQDSKLKILAALTQLRQICCDPHLCFDNYDGPTGKLEACLELVAGSVENGHQVLLFSQFTSMLDTLRARLDGMGISNYTLQGSTTKEKRAQLVKQFNAGGASVFLISLKAGGTGLNLTAADVVIHYDPWWNIAAQNQATDRAHRIGQQSCVQVYKLIAGGTIEEKILLLQEKKAALMELISQDTGGDILNLSREDLLELLQYQPA